MNFGDAITLLKAGHKLHRTNWNGKGMWVELQRPDENSKMTLPYLFLNYPDGRAVPWLASQTDVLEEDWMICVDVAVTDPTWQQIADLSQKEFNKELRALADDPMVFKLKKPHWTQTPEGKKKIAARKKRGWKK